MQEEVFPRGAGLSPRQERRRQAARRLAMEGLRLMADRGIAGCSVADITAAAGVGKGTFFTHFPSKESFTAFLLEQQLAELARRVGPLGLGPVEPETLLADLALAHLRFFQRNPQAAALLQQALALPSGGPASPLVRARLRDYLAMLTAKLAPAAQALGWPGERSAELALALLSLGAGYAWLGQALGLGQDTPPELSERLGRALARGLAR
ncbi:MAG: TetR/AcrR family transcriptional regulator [Thermodesulfobacteriota bacterium]